MLKRALRVLVLCASATVVLVPGPGALGAPQKGRCDRHRAVKRNHNILVFRKQTTEIDEAGHRVTDFYACARPRGGSIAVAVNSEPANGHYVAGDVLEQLLLAGRYTGSLDLTGGDRQLQCQRYSQAPCPTPYVRLFFADVPRLAGGGVDAPQGTHGLVLSAEGAAGWLVPHGHGTVDLVGTLLKFKGRRLRLSPRTLDSGHISHVSIDGHTLVWRNGGNLRAAKLT